MLFTVGIVFLILPVITIMNRSAEFTTRDVVVVLQAILAMLFIYVVSVADADYVGRKGRQLFNMAMFRSKTGAGRTSTARLQQLAIRCTRAGFSVQPRKRCRNIEIKGSRRTICQFIAVLIYREGLCSNGF